MPGACLPVFSPESAASPQALACLASPLSLMVYGIFLAHRFTRLLLRRGTVSSGLLFLVFMAAVVL